MAASLSRSSASPNSSGLTAAIGPSAPHLTLFTICLLLFLYGYEIFNFSLSPDEELYGSGYEMGWWLLAIAQGRWAMGLLDHIFPPIGNIPTIATVFFCAGLGVSACLLARVLFRKHSAQLAFVGIYVASPLWPHLVEFNVSSWQIGLGYVLLTVALLFFISGRRFGDLWATVLLIVATGIYQSFYTWFLVLLCIRHLSILLGTGPAGVTEPQPRFPWLRTGLIAVGGIVGYVVVERLLLTALSLQLTYIQGYVRLAEFQTAPAQAVRQTLQRSWNLLSGGDPIFLGYGHILTLLPLLGLVIVVGRLVWSGPLKPSQRLVGGAILAATLVLALSLLVVSAGGVPTRALTSWIPISAFLAGVTFSFSGRFEKLLYAALAAALLVSIWVSVSLLYTDHLARQRDQFLAARIMARVDNILPNPPPGRIPFVVVGAVPARTDGPFRKLEIFGDSFFDASHEGGNPWRVAAYLRTLGVDTLAPQPLAVLDPYRPTIEAMPIWPAAGSVAMVNGVLVIKLGPLPPT
jgi:hypothetical protein